MKVRHERQSAPALRSARRRARACPSRRSRPCSRSRRRRGRRARAVSDRGPRRRPAGRHAAGRPGGTPIRPGASSATAARDARGLGHGGRRRGSRRGARSGGRSGRSASVLRRAGSCAGRGPGRRVAPLRVAELAARTRREDRLSRRGSSTARATSRGTIPWGPAAAPACASTSRAGRAEGVARGRCSETRQPLSSLVAPRASEHAREPAHRRPLRRRARLPDDLARAGAAARPECRS